MLPSDMNLNIKTGTAGYNNKVLISDSKFNLGKNDHVNALELAKATIRSHKVIVQSTATQGLPLTQKQTNTHKEEKAASILLTGAFTIWYMF